MAIVNLLMWRLLMIYLFALWGAKCRIWTLDRWHMHLLIL